MGVADVLKGKAREWAEQVVRLHNTQVPAKLQKEKDFLINAAKKIKDSIEFGSGTIPELAPIAELDSDLGIIPAIAAGIGLAGASGAIAWWLSRWQKLRDQMAADNKAKALYDELRKEGRSQEEATRIARTLYPSRVGTAMSTEVVKSLVLLGGASFAIWYLTKRFR